ncbi:avidin [Oncorhynchus kisutch]|uniref:avidin-like n=1 Tax=Oncorhynchus kisutch TaxID=8019 RepID=UPI0012DF73B8|nr:avidin-like [Oncorhynchus kisutch]XP_031654240.1 avidin [Oncorhynchus kisutch]
MAEVTKIAHLSGVWKNELGSIMTLKFEPTNSALSGTYKSLVGEHPHDTKELNEPLVGFYNIKEPQMPTIAFCISWGNIGSCSAFTGQYFNENNQEVIKTTWILRSSEPSLGQDWEGTRVGTDIFLRVAK